MAKINAGLLHQATPITAKQEINIEAKVLESQQASAYLNADEQICFALPTNPMVIKDLAWHKAYELFGHDGTHTKIAYKKTGPSSFTRDIIQEKPVDEDSWLPQEYQRVAFLENSGTQFIDTGIQPNNNMSVEIKYQSMLPSYSQYIMGSRIGTSTIHYGLNGSSSTNNWSTRFTDLVFDLNNLTRCAHIIKASVILNNGAGTWTATDIYEGKTGSTTLSGITVSNTAPNLYIFAFSASCIHSDLRVYGCRLYNGNKLVRDFVPCINRLSGEVGMFDNVSRTLFKNSGTGDFITGPEL